MTLKKRLAQLETAHTAAAHVPVIQIVGMGADGRSHPGFALVLLGGRYVEVSPHADERLDAFTARCEAMTEVAR